ncbi:MAG: sigma-70 family RNA polymerase sigma factor [Gammaproteobacteria bacterium]|nr:sigma-70 family RNA polymerase sigma factor [Gammaproteobacteria bacterium]
MNPRNDNIIDLASAQRSSRKRVVQTLFERHAEALRLFLRGRSVAPEEIDDLLQELFTRLMDAHRLEEKMADSTGSSRSYLLTMANGLMVDRWRKEQVRNAHADAVRNVEQGHTDELSPERIVAAQMELEAIKAVILDMPLNWRVALLLQRMRNMSYEDIALHMGVQVKQVDNYLVRALRRLRKARRRIEAAGEQSC